LALLSLVPSTIIGVVEYGVAGNVDWRIGVPLAIGATILAAAGAAAAGLLPQRILSQGFALLQVVAGIALAE
jgi:uncharacterized membrane protein YfcA